MLPSSALPPIRRPSVFAATLGSTSARARKGGLGREAQLLPPSKAFESTTHPIRARSRRRAREARGNRERRDATPRALGVALLLSLVPLPCPSPSQWHRRTRASPLNNAGNITARQAQPGRLSGQLVSWFNHSTSFSLCLCNCARVPAAALLMLTASTALADGAVVAGTPAQERLAL